MLGQAGAGLVSSHPGGTSRRVERNRALADALDELLRGSLTTDPVATPGSFGLRRDSRALLRKIKTGANLSNPASNPKFRLSAPLDEARLIL